MCIMFRKVEGSVADPRDLDARMIETDLGGGLDRLRFCCLDGDCLNGEIPSTS